jgi:hypothetical protein
LSVLTTHNPMVSPDASQPLGCLSFITSIGGVM